MALRLWASRTASILRLRPNEQLFLSLSRAYSAQPDNLKFLKSHEWADIQEDVATVGISEYAEKALGEVVFVELPEVGSLVTQGKPFGVVESVKAASDVYSPLSGRVVDVNSELQANPGLVNDGPFAEGWMMKVRISDLSETRELLDAAAYAKECESH